MEERRKHVRVFVDGWQIRLLSDPLKVHLGSIIDLSYGGLRFICEQKLDPEEMIDFEVIFPTGKKFIGSAKIIYRKDPEGATNKWIYGVGFEGLLEELKQEIKYYIEQNTKTEDSDTLN